MNRSIDHQDRRSARIHLIQARCATIAAEFPTIADAWQHEPTDGRIALCHLGDYAANQDRLWDGRGTAAYPTWREYLTAQLATATN